MGSLAPLMVVFFLCCWYKSMFCSNLNIGIHQGVLPDSFFLYVILLFKCSLVPLRLRPSHKYIQALSQLTGQLFHFQFSKDRFFSIVNLSTRFYLLYLLYGGTTFHDRLLVLRWWSEPFQSRFFAFALEKAQWEFIYPGQVCGYISLFGVFTFKLYSLVCNMQAWDPSIFTGFPLASWANGRGGGGCVWRTTSQRTHTSHS